MTLWAYETLNERVERRERLFKDPEWIAFLTKARAAVGDAGNANSEAGDILQRTPEGHCRDCGKNAMTTNLV